MPKALVIDDDGVCRLALKALLEKYGFSVFTATNGREGERAAGLVHPDIIFVDIFMPDMDGLEFICALHKCRPETPIVAISTPCRLPGYDPLVIAVALGASLTIAKPISVEKIEMIKARLAGRTTTT